jgi:hypothetical protein
MFLVRRRESKSSGRGEERFRFGLAQLHAARESSAHELVGVELQLKQIGDRGRSRAGGRIQFPSYSAKQSCVSNTATLASWGRAVFVRSQIQIAIFSAVGFSSPLMSFK